MHAAGRCLASLALALVVGLVGSTRSVAQHPHPQPVLEPSKQTTQGDTTTVVTGVTFFPPSNPFLNPPGTNFLPTIYTNVFDGNNKEMPNTLPSTPTIPYNLHDGEPTVRKINPTSPTDDLYALFGLVLRKAATATENAFDANATKQAIQRGLDILEGHPIPNRAYSGLPLLHYTGPEKVKRVTPIVDAQGQKIGGNVNIHQVWYDSHIESDTSLLDPSDVLEVPWTITYTVDVLNRGRDDFSPFVMYTDDPALSPRGQPPKPHIGMDQSFFPMPEGTQTVFKIKMTPGKYYNLTYTWGWRMHPPRVQVSENATKTLGGKTLVEWETAVFGKAPRSSEAARLAAIAMIGDLAPAKRMWTALRDAKQAADQKDFARVKASIEEAQLAFYDWRERTRLPTGVEVDKTSDLTLLYVNNTIYGEFTDGGLLNFPRWQERGAILKVTLYNGDYFDHGYQNVDFGGARGWENQFKSSVKVAGSGCWFTFGRVYWWMNLNPMVTVPAATKEQPVKPGVHKVQITYNYEPSRRLRFYQFDPTHHDVAVFSVH